MEFLHVGINAKDAADAENVAQSIAALFGVEVTVGNSSIFLADRKIEIMKGSGRGEHGHICFGSHNIEEDIAKLQAQGVEFDESSAKYKDGKLSFMYMKGEIAGFALQILSY